MIEQISVFMENKSGRLYKLTKTLGDAGIDLVMLTIADTTEFGIVRIITKENEKALKALKEAGFTASCTNLIGIEVDDQPGGLASMLKLIDDCEINVEYLYSFARDGKNNAMILFKVENAPETVETLKKNNVKIVSNLK